MLPEQPFQFTGMNGRKGGWFAVIASPATPAGPGSICRLEVKKFFVAKTFADVLYETGHCKLICVDIPIGLSDGPDRRYCDVAARKLLGPGRASSIFPAPIRPLLHFPAAGRL